MLFRTYPRFIVAAAAVAAAFVLTPTAASAVSLEVTGRVGYGSAGSDSPVRFEGPATSRLVGMTPDPIWRGAASPYGGGLMLEGGLGLRTGKFISVGLGGGMRSASAESPDPTITDVSRSSWNAGPFVRVYLPFVPIVDPYVGLGVVYMSDVQKYKSPVPTNIGPYPADWTLEHHAVAVPLTLGADYTIAKIFSVGPYFQYALAFPVGACAKIKVPGGGSSYCSDDDDSKRIVTGKGYGVWSLGLSLRLTFPPV